MSIVHRITGYDERTELMTHEFDIPPDRLTEVRALARMSAEDAEDLGSYPLENGAARAIAERMALPVRVETCDWFLEPLAIA